MKHSIRLVVLLVLLANGIGAFAQSAIKDLKPTVILISIDGFRYDYFEKFQPATINRLAREGVRAKWMTPSFPSKTFPNHYTIVTGLYPANHGIVENSVYDFGTTFSMGKKEEVQNGRWWLGEPIWVTAEKQGQIAASFFFVGSEAEIGGKRPTYWNEYNGKVVPQMRVDKVLGWLDLPVEKRPTMITMYFSDVDDAAHEFNPESEETGYSVQNVDSYITRLMDGLKKRKIDKKVNIILVSDHGLAKALPSQVTLLDEYFDIEKLTDRVLWSNEIVQIFPKSADAEDQIMASVKDLKNATCWRKKDIPDRFHYKHGPRVAPVVCSPSEGWGITNRKRHKDRGETIDMNKQRGEHGYDNQFESMRAMFVGYGPAFKKGLLVEPFDNIHVYNVMTKILGLTPARNDGNFTLADQILKK